jgi:hypothetical protein
MVRYAVMGAVESGSWGNEMWPHDDPDYVGCRAVDFDSWEARAGRRPHLEIEGEPGEVSALDLIGRIDGKLPGWALRLRLVPDVDGLRISHREERERPRDIEEGIVVNDDGSTTPYARFASPRPVLISSKQLANLGFGSVDEHVKALLTNTVIRERILGPDWNRPRLRPHRKQQDEHTYALWANRYVWALEQDGGRRSPNSYIAKADTGRGVYRTTKQVEGKVAQAKARGLLTRSKRGIAGGELTDHCRKLLADLDVTPGSDRLVVDGSYNTERVSSPGVPNTVEEH